MNSKNENSEFVEEPVPQEPLPPKDIQFQNIINIDKGFIKRILFIACCLKGGLTSDEQIFNAYNWALKDIGFFFYKLFFLKMGI